MDYTGLDGVLVVTAWDSHFCKLTGGDFLLKNCILYGYIRVAFFMISLNTCDISDFQRVTTLGEQMKVKLDEGHK